MIKVVPLARAKAVGAPGGLSFVLLLLTASSDEELAAIAPRHPVFQIRPAS